MLGNIFSHWQLHWLISVSKYTREAGVRTLERRVGGICRAVAVRVAESSLKHKNDVFESASEKKKVVNDSLSESSSQDASALAHPPEMPIVIDEVALEDILGVRNVNWAAPRKKGP